MFQLWKYFLRSVSMHHCLSNGSVFFFKSCIDFLEKKISNQSQIRLWQLWCLRSLTCLSLVSGEGLIRLSANTNWWAVKFIVLRGLSIYSKLDLELSCLIQKMRKAVRQWDLASSNATLGSTQSPGLVQCSWGKLLWGRACVTPCACC